MLLMTQQEVIEMAFIPREQITPLSIRDVKIDIAQEHFIRPRIGDQLFNEILEGDHAQFVSHYIKAALAHFVRYGLIQELAVQIGDKGALLYNSTQINDIYKESKLSTLTIRDDTDSETRATDGTLLLETQIKTENLNGEKTTSADHSVMSDTSSQDSVLATEKSIVDSENKVDRNESLKKESKTIAFKDTTNTRSDGVDWSKTGSNESFRSATAVEIRMLTWRALSDANILLAKAVRYIESHAELFENYVPAVYSGRIFI